MRTQVESPEKDEYVLNMKWVVQSFWDEAYLACEFPETMYHNLCLYILWEGSEKKSCQDENVRRKCWWHGVCVS